MKMGYEIEYVIFVFPFISFIFGIIGQMIIKNLYIVNIITFLLWFILTYTVFNKSFLIWVFIYTGLSLLGSGIIYFYKEKNKKN